MILININWGDVTGTISSILNSKFIITVLTSWPLAAVIIVVAVRGSLKKIIEDRLSNLKVGNMEISFEKLLATADEGLNRNELPSEENDERENSASVSEIQRDVSFEVMFSRFKAILDSNIAAAVDYCWSFVKTELNDLAINAGYLPLDDNDSNTIEELKNLNVISGDLVKSLDILRKINCEENAHKFSKLLAFEYFDRCYSAIKQLQKLKGEVSA
ncbi:hypothetical protein NRS6085_01170 [Bacillus subtilis]|uniref:hypothetical protein n=1 Tax=Bacillus subtilis TaxID=1423 RepID=UPI001B9191F9|nr:hypothetical protein [Bacillus subtilis]CAF1826123.1 hypothetical protein NRS6085_04402 [Bacillus subtilis]CAI6222189.1 hypothetical protein NRS6085_01170 [Bacillus subtilis]